jgi:hypothetical protein
MGSAMRWMEFARACPELGELGARRFAADELILLGTLKEDGWPRLSPVEPDLVAGELMLGMIWRSGKARDLLRDPRCTVHSIPHGRLNPPGDLKLYGLGRSIEDLNVRAAYRAAIKARIGWEPDEPRFHLFAVDVESAAYVRFDDDVQERWSWTPGAGLVRRSLPNP